VPRLSSADIGCLARQYRDVLTSLRAVDDLIGDTVSKLTRAGELNNTVLIFTSDNGFFYGDHRLTDKVLGYERSIRVPLAIRAPGFAGSQTAAQFVLNNDLAPTIAEFAGVVPPLSVDGRSLVPLLRNPAETHWRRRFLVEYLGTVNEGPMVGPRYPFSAIRTTLTGPEASARNKFYVEWKDEAASREFYDLSSDPNELASQQDNPAWAEVRANLAGWLAKLETCGNGTCQTWENQ